MSWSPNAAASVPRQFRARSQPQTFSPTASPASTLSRKPSGSAQVTGRARTESLSATTAAMQVGDAEPANGSNGAAANGWKKRKASRADLEEPARGMPSPVIGEPSTPQFPPVADHSPAFTVDSTPGLTNSPALSTQSHPPPLTPGFTYAFENESAAAAAGEEGDGSEEGEEGKKVVRRKIRIEYIQDKSRRHITFSKRKAGIMKKAYELATLTGTQVLLLVVSETGLVYTFTTTKLQPLVTQTEGKNLIQACLNTRDGENPSFHGNSDMDEPESNPNFQPSVPVQGGQVALKAKLPGLRDRRGSINVPGPRIIRRASMPQPHLGPLPPSAPPMSLPGGHHPYESHRMAQHPFASPGGLHIAGLGLDSPHPSPIPGFEHEMSHDPQTPGADSVMTSSGHMHPSIMPHSAFHFAHHDVHYVHGPEHSPDVHYAAMHTLPQPIPMYLPPQPMTPGGHHHHQHLQHLSSPMAAEPPSPHPSLHPHHGPVVDYSGLTVSPREMNGRYSPFDHPVDNHVGTPVQVDTPLSAVNGQQDYFLTQPAREEDTK